MGVVLMLATLPVHDFSNCLLFIIEIPTPGKVSIFKRVLMYQVTYLQSKTTSMPKLARSWIQIQIEISQQLRAATVAYTVQLHIFLPYLRIRDLLKTEG